MMRTIFSFPPGFLWGTATASHQVEGNNTNNNWYVWEREGHTQGNSGLACDWWGGRWKEDLDRAAALGQNTHRLSLEWSRIQPSPERFDEEALEYYALVLQGLRDRGLEPMVTLHHFTDPIWLGMGAWETESTVDSFVKYVRKAVERLQGHCTLWCTINEPNVYTLLAYADNKFPPGKPDLRLALRVMANLLRGHAAAYKAIHEIQAEARVGFAHHHRPMVPRYSWFPLDRLVCKLQFRVINEAFPYGIFSGVMPTPFGHIKVPEAKGTQDYFGLNYYSQDTVAFDPGKPGELFGRRYYPKGSDITESGMNINYPEGLYRSLQWALQFKVPIYITENGIEDDKDPLRRRYLAGHLYQVWRAIGNGCPVKGYYHWSLIDNFEWERGWTQRFGLWEMDPVAQVRRKRPSADFYGAISKENGLSREMVNTFCPEMRKNLFPLV
jgi:beta-glucosidase